MQGGKKKGGRKGGRRGTIKGQGERDFFSLTLQQGSSMKKVPILGRFEKSEVRI